MTYIQNVINTYVTQFIAGREGDRLPVKVVTRAKFNPNFKTSWFTSVMQIVSNLTMITVMLTGAALIREREQGTVEHLLVMPVVPAEIMLSKILANGIIILACSGPIAAACGAVVAAGADFRIDCFSWRRLHLRVHGRGAWHCPGTVASTMAQFGLLSIPVLLVMMLLSGSTTPMESMPVWLQYLMNVISPTPHFVVFAQDVLYRGADFSIVWPRLLARPPSAVHILAFIVPVSKCDFQRLSRELC